jgi:ATP-dependent DNA ligase
MLAQKFTKSGHHIEYPAFIQPKLNGVRCFAKKISEFEIDYSSRKGKSFNGTLQHLTPSLLHVLKTGDILDGEIYRHDWGFQQIIRRVKKLRPDTNRLQFHAYDFADENLDFYERLGKLVLLKIQGFVQIVETGPIMHSDAVKIFHDKFIQQGYEGAIVRNAAGKYKFNHRDKNLQKYKEFIDEEFVIVGFHTGTGTEEGCIVFEVQAKKGGVRFSVRPKGSRETKRRWVQEFENIRGRELTVRYQELSEDNVPIFPVGIAIRDYE